MHSAVYRAHLLEPKPVMTDPSLSWSELKPFDIKGLEIRNEMAENVKKCNKTISEVPHTCGSPDEITVRQFSDGVRLIVRAGREDDETCGIFVVARYTNASGIVDEQDEDKTYIELPTRGGWDVKELEEATSNALKVLIGMRIEREGRVAEPQPQVPDSASEDGRNDQKKSILSVLPRWRNGRAWRN